MAQQYSLACSCATGAFSSSVTQPSRPPSAVKAAAMSIAFENPALNTSGLRYDVPLSPAIGGKTATPTNPAARPTALFTAEAIPPWRGPTQPLNGAGHRTHLIPTTTPQRD